MTQAREITPYLIRLYLDKMRGDHMSSGLVARDYGAFKCFFRFLTQERLIPHNPITLVEKPRMERKLIKPLSMDQLRLMQLLAGKVALEPKACYHRIHEGPAALRLPTPRHAHWEHPADMAERPGPGQAPRKARIAQVGEQLKPKPRLDLH